MREYTHIAGAVLFFLIFAYLLNLVQSNFWHCIPSGYQSFQMY